MNRSIAAGYGELADNREKYMSEEHRVYSRNANYLYRNDQVMDAIITTGLAACTAIPNPASPGCFTSLVAYKTARGAYEGGVVGAGAALGSAALTSTMRSTGFGVNFGYSYANGYSAGINYGIPGQTTGIQGGVGYSQRNGWNAKIGYGFKNGVNLSYDHSEFGGDTYTGTLANNYGGAFLNYNTENGYSGGINVTSNGSIFGNPLGAFSTLGYGNSGVYNDVSYFVPEKAPLTEAEREQAAESARNNLLNNILGGIGYVAGRVGDFAKGIWDRLFGEEDGDSDRGFKLISPNLAKDINGLKYYNVNGRWIQEGTFADLITADLKPGDVAAILEIFSKHLHGEMTEEVLRSLGFSKKDIELVSNANKGQDYHQGTPKFHFDGAENFQQIMSGGMKYIEEQWDLINGEKSTKNEILQAFGRIAHAIQDFYSHSNYVELYLKNVGDPEGKVVSPVDVPTFFEAMTSANLQSFRDILIKELRTGVFSVSNHFMGTEDPNDHYNMNHDDPSRPRHGFARSAAARDTYFIGVSVQEILKKLQSIY
ncbi:HET-C-related protein [Leptospira inadai]|uniref:HET-C-related protein n=1 Tax=Leptospira inadai TaxID=29506 RepID=UPI001EE31180|nr:HET-C-related protein [Leptospira inadai]